MSEIQTKQFFIDIAGIIILILFSVIYTFFYSRTRKMDLTNRDMMLILKKNLLICICANAVLIFADPFSDRGSYRYILLLLFGITENIDLFIRKIPTEILILASIPAVSQISGHNELPYLAAGILFSCLWFLVKRKIRIGINDIILILILTVFLSGFSETVLFNSVIMIIWGIAGFLVQKLGKKEPKTLIPLAPVIITAFTVVKLLR